MTNCKGMQQCNKKLGIISKEEGKHLCQFSEGKKHKQGKF